MKIFFSILALLLTTKECDKKKAYMDKTTIELVNSQDSNQQQKNYNLEYSAISRGLFKEVKIYNDTISVQKSRQEKPVVAKMDISMRDDLLNELDEIDITSLPELKAPTEKRFFDGAAHATLKITVDGKTYSTTSFDHGFPPEEIKLLCDRIVKYLE